MYDWTSSGKVKVRASVLGCFALLYLFLWVVYMKKKKDYHTLFVTAACCMLCYVHCSV